MVWQPVVSQGQSELGGPVQWHDAMYPGLNTTSTSGSIADTSQRTQELTVKYNVSVAVCGNYHFLKFFTKIFVISMDQSDLVYNWGCAGLSYHSVMWGGVASGDVLIILLWWEIMILISLVNGHVRKSECLWSHISPELSYNHTFLCLFVWFHVGCEAANMDQCQYQ